MPCRPVHAALTVLPLLCLATLHRHLHDRCDASLGLVEFDGVAARVRNRLLAIG